MKYILTQLETGLQKQRSSAQATCVCCNINGVSNFKVERHG